MEKKTTVELSDKELTVLNHAMYLYNAHLEKELNELAEIMKERRLQEEKRKKECCRDMICCCFSIDEYRMKPENIKYWRDAKFCEKLRDKVKQTLMILPTEMHKDYSGRDFRLHEDFFSSKG